MEAKRSGKPSHHITEARAAAQRAKLDSQAQESPPAGEETANTKPAIGKKKQRDPLTRRRATTTLEQAIADFLADHEGGSGAGVLSHRRELRGAGAPKRVMRSWVAPPLQGQSPLSQASNRPACRGGADDDAAPQKAL
jgi:hypothetical protein